MASAVPANKSIYLSLVDDAGEDGFRAFVQNESLIIECAFKSLYEETFDAFIESEMKGKKEIAIGTDYTYSKHIATVKYSDFGVSGDGVTNDFFNILKAHEHANITKQTVIAKAGKNQFYIGQTWTEDGNEVTIPIKSNVDFTGATFYFDDNVEGVYDHRGQHLFAIRGDIPSTKYTALQMDTWAQTRPISTGATNIPWLAGRLPAGKYYVKFIDENQKDFIRYGVNSDGGSSRVDVILVDANGDIDPTTPVAYPVGNVTELLCISCDEVPITVKGGTFITKCKQAPSSGNAPSAYIYRGILLSRVNATITGLTHKLQNEPTARGYSSYGIVTIRDTANVTFKDSVIVGRRSYNDCSSYGLTMHNVINITCDNVDQSNDITSETYWGITATNGCKNLTFKDCKLSRIDAHRSVWNITISNCEVGRDITLIGGGNCVITDTKRTVGWRFINLREDYGASFNGKITLKNCSFTTTANTTICVIGSGFLTTNEYLNHDFGYKCYMPTEVKILNFTCTKSYYVFNNIADTAFTKNKYVLTSRVYYNSSTKPTLCPSSSCTKIRSIPMSKASS